MAANQIDIPFRSVALVAATAKTVAGVKASTNVAIKILEAAVSMDGATSSNAPAVIDYNRSTFATNGPGTNSTTFTPSTAIGKRDPGRAETVQATCATSWSTEPTVLTALHSMDVGQYNGVYHYINPFASPIIVVGGQGYVLTGTSPNNVNITGRLTFEE